MFARIQEMERLEHLRDSGEINRLTKKEGLLIQREINRLEIRLSGLRKMKRLPDYVFIVDVCRETTAVLEANKLNIPVIALVDTNCDPTGVDYVIPSNDDAIRAIKLLVAKMADAVLEGKAMRKDEEPEMVAPAAPVVESAAKAGAQADEEVELADAQLLGESTLAKLTAQEEESVPDAEGEKPAQE
jgi:small subunit ribosomal protein S2